MKNIPAFLLPLLLCGLSFSSNAQNFPLEIPSSGGAYLPEYNDAGHPCITPQEYAMIEQRCADNMLLPGMTGSGQKNMLITPLNWPLQPANGLDDCSFYAIGAYVDHNTTTGAVSDFNCGTYTYDGHGGTDIGIPPFAFYKMDNNQVEVVAAAAGTILDKADGNFDRNCGVNNLQANYVIVQHADGSRALYWHMKKNSVTAKSIGQSVVAGEYLGVVGSSGSSSGPHLHFEVWSGSTAGTRVDPYAGSCNTWNANSWWASQKPYKEPAIVKASVNTTDIVTPGCPVTETLNESDCFSLPFQGAGLPPGAAKFYIFIRNETIGMTADVSILNPNGSTFNSWTHNSTQNYNASWRSWTKTLPSIPGTYTLKTTYNGITCSKTFDIIHPIITANGTILTSNYASGNQWYWNGNMIAGATAQTYPVTQNGNYTVVVTNSNGCTATSAVFSFINTGTETISEDNTMVVFPNPNNGQFILEMGNAQMEGGVLEIYNLLGDRIFISEMQPRTSEMDISAQPDGMYFIMIRSPRGKQVIRFLKM